MNKLDIIRKLTSRKLWMAIAGFVSGLLVALGKTNEVAVTIAGLIVSGGSVISYIFAEGWTDAASYETLMFPDFSDEEK